MEETTEEERVLFVDSTLLAPKVRITKSTGDLVIMREFPIPANLLKRFEHIKQIANYADGERDRLRAFIQEHFDAGRYDNVLLTFEHSQTLQMYPNADGKFVLKSYLLTSAPKQAADKVGHAVIVLETMTSTAEEFLDEILKAAHVGKEHALKLLQDMFLGSGLIIDNETLYTEKGSVKIKVTELPDETKTAS